MLTASYVSVGSLGAGTTHSIIGPGLAHVHRDEEGLGRSERCQGEVGLLVGLGAEEPEED